MATVDDFRAMYRYNWRVLRDYCDGLSTLPPEAVEKDREATYGSMKKSSTTSSPSTTAG